MGRGCGAATVEAMAAEQVSPLLLPAAREAGNYHIHFGNEETNAECIGGRGEL